MATGPQWGDRGEIPPRWGLGMGLVGCSTNMPLLWSWKMVVGACGSTNMPPRWGSECAFSGHGFYTYRAPDGACAQPR